jgi:predicted metal-binding protein
MANVLVVSFLSFASLMSLVLLVLFVFFVFFVFFVRFVEGVCHLCLESCMLQLRQHHQMIRKRTESPLGLAQPHAKPLD